MDEGDPRGRDPRGGVRDADGGHRRARRRDRRPRLSAKAREIAVVVDDGTDGLAASVADALTRRGHDVEAVPARELALVPLDLDAPHAAVAGRRVGALLFRARPTADFGGGFAEQDASFSASEARAAWLAVMALASISVVNRFDAESWFSFSEWPLWWRRMRAAGMTTAELAAGGGDAPRDAKWLPWGGAVATVPTPPARRAFGAAMVSAAQVRRTTWCYGEIVGGMDAPAVRTVGRVLESFGVNLAEIVTADDHTYVSCTAHPVVPRTSVAAATGRITGVVDAHLRRR